MWSTSGAEQVEVALTGTPKQSGLGMLASLSQASLLGQSAKATPEKCATDIGQETEEVDV